jgi:molecular chaperone DnaK
MAKDAEAHAAEDKEARDKVEARNGLDSLVYNVEKMLKDSGDKVTEADKADVDSALADAKAKLTEDASASDLNAVKERLTSASHKLAEAMYKAAAAAPPPAEGAAPAGEAAGTQEPGKKDEGVIDAEYVDVDK